MPRILYLLLVSPMLFSSGCLIPYYVCPKLSCVPGTNVEAPVDTVHAFRVDTRQSTPYAGIGRTLPTSHQFTPLTLDVKGDLPAQYRLSCTRGFFAFFVALNYVTWHQDTLAVRLYRPGYETVELPSWDLDKKVTWKKAATHADQVKAVDDLLSGRLEPGGVSKEHRAVLLFAADEYRRLAADRSIQGPPFEAIRVQMQEKEAQLRKQAEHSDERGGLVERLID
jgi:hypothetical protein